MKIGFIGIGKLGLPCAEEISKKHHYVEGYDVSTVSSDLITVVNSIKECVIDKDIVFIAVPTPHDPDYDGSTPSHHLPAKDFDYSIVKSCLIEANNYMNKDQLLVLISTVLPGTTRNQFVNLITNTRFIYNPYLIAMGSVAWDMVNPEMVIIGTEDGAINGDAKQLIDFYKTIMENNPRYEIGTWDEAESIKIFYNTFITAKLTIVNMIQDVAVKLGNINVDVVTNALAKSNIRITGQKYMVAGMGDSGACHPRDNIALMDLAKKLDLKYDLFQAILKSRDMQAKNMAEFLVDLAKTNNMVIYIHGKAYKPKVPYTNGSYSLLVGYYCEQHGYNPIYIDPLTNDFVESAHGVILLAHNTEVTYNYNNPEEQQLYCKIIDGSIIVDPWRKFKTDNNKITVIPYGNTRKNF
jgi:UDPglucose 6-dehydrogenase